MSLTPSERRLRASLAGRTGWANTPDPSGRARHMHQGFRKKLELQIDPDGILPPEERARRAEKLYKAHFQKMSFKAAKNRRLRREQQEREAEQMRTARSVEALGEQAAS